MPKAINIQSFELQKACLKYDLDKSILSCINKSEKKIWVKKLNSVDFIADIIEDKSKYYIACGAGSEDDDSDRIGQFIALNKKTGETEWFIPGKPFLNIIAYDYLFAIFADEDENFYLLKINPKDGTSGWNHPVDRDLKEYSFAKNRIFLKYASGREESLPVAP